LQPMLIRVEADPGPPLLVSQPVEVCLDRDRERLITDRWVATGAGLRPR